jgi:hypothetical protein
MVEMHYEEEDAVTLPDGSEALELRHWRIVLADEDAAVAQAAQDIAEGRNPISIVERPAKDPWDYRLEYDSKKWRTLVPRSRLRTRARGVGPAVGDADGTARAIDTE